MAKNNHKCCEDYCPEMKNSPKTLQGNVDQFVTVAPHLLEGLLFDWGYSKECIVVF